MQLGSHGFQVGADLAPLERMTQQWGDEGIAEESYLGAALFLRWQTW